MHRKISTYCIGCYHSTRPCSARKVCLLCLASPLLTTHHTVVSARGGHARTRGKRDVRRARYLPSVATPSSTVTAPHHPSSQRFPRRWCSPRRRPCPPQQRTCSPQQRTRSTRTVKYQHVTSHEVPPSPTHTIPPPSAFRASDGHSKVSTRRIQPASTVTDPSLSPPSAFSGGHAHPDRGHTNHRKRRYEC